MAKKKTMIKKPLPLYDRTVFDIIDAIRGVSATEIMRRTKGQVSDRTVNNLRRGPKNGGTKWPRHYTVMRMLHAVGCEFTITDIDSRVGHNSKKAGALRLVA
jgi:hypothetical protein